jgi:hypothetical protein
MNDSSARVSQLLVYHLPEFYHGTKWIGSSNHSSQTSGALPSSIAESFPFEAHLTLRKLPDLRSAVK